MDDGTGVGRNTADRYRARAASAATLTAAVSGAVVVGLVLAPPVGASSTNRLFTSVAVILLIAATLAWTVAAQMHVRPKDDPVWFRRFRLGTGDEPVPQKSSPLTPSTTKQPKDALHRVIRAMDVAAVISVTAIVALLLTFMSLIWEKPVHVVVLLSTPIDASVCKNGPSVVQGTVAHLDNVEAAGPLLLKIKPESCGGDAPEIRISDENILSLTVRTG